MTRINEFAKNAHLRTAIQFAGFLYILGVAALLIANHTIRHTSPFVALAGTFNLYLFVAALPLVLCLILLRTPVALAILLLIAALFMWAYPLLSPVSAVLSKTNVHDPISVMTFNLGAYLTAPEQLARSIALSNADLVAVQELTPQSAAVLSARLALAYPYQILDPSFGSTGFLSKLPIVSYELHRPPAGRPFLHVVTEYQGSDLHVFPVHFYPPGIVWFDGLHLPRGLIETALEAEVDYLLQQVVNVSGPIIVLGDFNMSDQSRAYSMMSAALQDSFRQAGTGLGRTFPNNFHLSGIRIPFPLIRIDYLFHSPHLQTTSHTVHCIENQSDHCALLIRLGSNSDKPI